MFLVGAPVSVEVPLGVVAFESVRNARPAVLNPLKVGVSPGLAVLVAGVAGRRRGCGLR